MALLDLALVTQALVDLLKAHIGNSPGWPFATYGAPLVTAEPPDQVGPGTLGVYLYHVCEEAHLKNQPPVGRDVPPVRFTPMGLSLHYQISALGTGAGEQITKQEQTYIGCALKALHDFPVIDDNTVVTRRPPQPPLELLAAVGLDGAGNKLRIVMQPIPYSESSTFWNAASLVPRLALYYQVSVILLEPDRPSSVSGRVFQYGIQSFVGGAPRLDGSQNTLDIAVPGLAPQSLVARPAEVPVGGAVSFTGYNLSGDATRLLVQHFRWTDRVEVDAGWGVVASDDRVYAAVQPQADGRTVIPGLYSARVKVVRRRVLPDGSTRDFGVVSNATPFSIAARIDSLTFAAGIATITGYLFAEPDPGQPAFPPEAVQLCIGDTVLVEVPAAPPPALQPGQFVIDDPGTIRFRLPAGIVAGKPVSLRLFVLGAESPPRWFTP
jgi:hypothetical protein